MNETEPSPRESVTPPPSGGPPLQTLSAEQAAELQSLLVRLGAIDEKIGKINRFQQWSDKFHRKFHIAMTETLPVGKYSDAMRWLTRQLVRLEAALNLRDARVAVRSSFSRIHDKIRKLYQATAEEKYTESGKKIFYTEVAQALHLKKAFLSLKELSRNDLARVESHVMNLPVPEPPKGKPLTSEK